MSNKTMQALRRKARAGKSLSPSEYAELCAYEDRCEASMRAQGQSYVRFTKPAAAAPSTPPPPSTEGVAAAPSSDHATKSDERIGDRAIPIEDGPSSSESKAASEDAPPPITIAFDVSGFVHSAADGLRKLSEKHAEQGRFHLHPKVWDMWELFAQSWATEKFSQIDPEKFRKVRNVMVLGLPLVPVSQEIIGRARGVPDPEPAGQEAGHPAGGPQNGDSEPVPPPVYTPAERPAQRPPAAQHNGALSLVPAASAWGPDLGGKPGQQKAG